MNKLKKILISIFLISLLILIISFFIITDIAMFDITSRIYDYKYYLMMIVNIALVIIEIGGICLCVSMIMEILNE